ncbi:MAG TPA: hypothetical protein VMW10_03015 [Alphaproteobacteria bacterium]|nr:hypothetical protein [Alphaproteobacteria bacterium]
MMKQFLIYSGLFCMLNCEAQAIKLYLLSNHDNAGDHHQCLGVKHALIKLSHDPISTEDLNTKITPSLQIKNSIEKDLADQKVIVVGSGEGGIEGIKDLQSNPSLTTCLLSHMFLEAYQNPSLLEKVNLIALPTHVSAGLKDKLGSKLIETTGVAHNRQIEMVDEVYLEWGQKELPACDIYLAVVLGGDAPIPGPSKEMRLFTEEDATLLAKYVAQDANDACVLVLNGPRTGKHDADKKEILTVHRGGYSDRITELFQKELAARDVENVKIFDFQHGSQTPYNSFDLALGAVKATRGRIIVPGDSTSMVSEAIDTLCPGHVLVYESSAMNEVHHAHIASELAAGRAYVLTNYNDVSCETKKGEPKPGAATVISQRLLEAVND